MVTAGQSPAVTVRGITKRFPGVTANDAIDFEVLQGEIHALLGENGAGKSTLSNILTGLYRPDEGEIYLRGQAVQFHAPRDAIAAGIGMVHQHFRLAASFTVAENLVLGHRDAADRGLLLEPDVIDGRINELARRYRMPVNPRARIWQLSVGEQQRVEILKVLYRGARVLILDEPTSQLTPQEANDLFQTLRLMAGEGRAIIFISHKLDEVMAISNRVTVLRRGKVVGTVPRALTTTRELARMMVGRDVVFTQKKEGAAKDGRQVALELRNVSARGDLGVPALHDVDLTVHMGEIVGVAGVAGNGQRELAEVITGMRHRTAGTVLVAGRPTRGGDPLEAIRRGIAYVPDDRLGTGVAPSLSVAENLVLKAFRQSPISTQGFLHPRRIRSNALRLMQRFNIGAASPDTPTRQLSGGNIQKVLLARELSGNPRVLVASSPTSGLDVAATDAVRGLLLDAANGGVGTLLISEDLEEIFALADRIAVLYNGRITGILDRQQAHIEQIGLMMAGAA
ncbi:MAG TPA: ABC transporter ATP-binding protein [Candidatus Dormibacteraeota bacterium]|nr:ABC transporter ATP-binding protein [Candidatus Dormibacteraeota bacterium]